MDAERFYDTVGTTGLHNADILRFNWTLPHLLAKGSLLDVGCGEGYWVDFLGEKTSLSLQGMDVSSVRIDLAKDHLAESEIELQVADIEELEQASVDQVTALEVLEHLPDWESGFRKIVHAARKRAIVTVPYNEWILNAACTGCGEDTPLYGHLHSLTEKDFEKIDIDGSLTFDFFHIPYGLGHYALRSLNAFSRFFSATEDSNVGDQTLRTACLHCYEETPYTLHIARASKRLLKLAFNTPDYLLVRVDK
jgi:SAM-dependent methyltransferase